MNKRLIAPGSGALLVLVVLIALNLRPFLTAIGPLAPQIDARLALGMDALAWVTIVGIPFGIQHLKLALISLAPIGQ
ncbi:YccF domain-containing protein, partial [Aeromonas taiwanensis]|uniref:YccF domain-containing protein n=1 Tax=Aeromonas taiwanensis TaxID=633417 RepID=UPI003F743EE1